MTEQVNSTGVSEPQSSLTEEQIQAEVKKIQAAVAGFCDSHQLYKPCEENGTALRNYVESHDLDPASAQSYDAAYVALSSEGKLALYEESKLAAPEPPKAKDSLPPIGKASASDLGVGLADQQRARKKVDGVAPASGRDAFIKAAQKFVSKQIPGGPRLRLG